MTYPIARLLRRLELVKGETSDAITDWHGSAGEGALNMSNRLFGGVVIGQAIVAAGRTDPDRRVHSLQQVFLRGGNATDPLLYRVEKLFTGRTYASVRIEVHQTGQVISHAQVGFSSGIEGPDRQEPAPAIAARESTVNRDELRGRPNWDDQPVQMFVDRATENDGQPRLSTWMRPDGPMPDDPVLHQAVLGFVSDRALMSVSWRPHGPMTSFKGSTLDHSIWFHRPVRFDDWHSHDMRSPTIANGRGLSHGTIHHHGGTHVATTMQQGTFRPV